eukprot:scaffold2403_cov65-Phaeocystis_antarctica.AAC.2
MPLAARRPCWGDLGRYEARYFSLPTRSTLSEQLGLLNVAFIKHPRRRGVESPATVGNLSVKYRIWSFSSFFAHQRGGRPSPRTHEAPIASLARRCLAARVRPCTERTLKNHTAVLLVLALQLCSAAEFAPAIGLQVTTPPG